MSAVPILSAAAALLVILWDRLRTRRMLRRLARMLEEAARGDFREEDFDESLLSAVESRLASYLAASSVSARNLQGEKDAVKTLVADISHQTKTPIANLRLYAQLLEEQELTEEGRALAAALTGQAEKLQDLVQSLVKASRLETGIIVQNPRPLLLAPMLESAAAQFRPKAAEKGVSLTVEPKEVLAVFDPRWTEEAVCNLLDNAVKYTPPGGSVSVRVTAYELYRRIDVADTGPGVPEADQGKIFQRFYRSPDARDADGVGIGLYLVRKIAEGQGGYVKVFSKPGEGAKFSLFLPGG
ncbi:MAG: HAMP domain-containing histidine kinase [Oscillibacter sp.]|nr:HAMP domain-containing histidine kinase [Oscillibacter sp.]